MRQARVCWLGLAMLAVGYLAAAQWCARAQVTPAAAATEKKPDEARAAKAREYLALARKSIGSDRDSLLDIAVEDVAVTEAKLGDVAAAKKTLAMMTDASHQIRALIPIAEAQADSGDSAGAKATLAAAVKALIAAPTRRTTMPTSAPSEDPGNVRMIGVAQARSGDIAAAQKSARPMAPSWHKAQILAEIGRWQAKHGDMKNARENFVAATSALLRSQDPYPEFELSDVALMQYEAGDKVEARTTAGKIKDKLSFAGALSAIAFRQAKDGNQTAALATLSEARKACADAPVDTRMQWMRARILAGIAQAMAAAGDAAGAKAAIAEALKLNQAVPQELEMRSFIMAEISFAAAKIGDEGTAAEAKRQTTAAMAKLSLSNRVHAMWSLAGQQATAGDADGARETVMAAMKEGTIDSFETALQSRSVAGGMARSQGAKANLDWIATMPASHEKALAYAAAAADMMEDGK